MAASGLSSALGKEGEKAGGKRANAHLHLHNCTKNVQNQVEEKGKKMNFGKDARFIFRERIENQPSPLVKLRGKSTFPARIKKLARFMLPNKEEGSYTAI